MESPRPTQDSKQVRWMGRPSEEQLLGPLHRPLREVNVSFEPPPPPEWRLNETPAAAGTATPTRRWRIGPRDLVALVAVVAVVWLAVQSGDGLPFRSTEPAAPAAVGKVVSMQLAPDRADWTQLSPQSDAKAPASGKSGGHRGKDADGTSSGPGGNDDDPPTGGGGGGGSDKTKPLLETTIPGVGTVTVDQPELPTLPEVDVPKLPKLPDTGDLLPANDLLPETPTVSLP
jgi:hypothetical protein